MEVSLLQTGDPRWDDLLASTPHDFYHLPAYADVAAQEEGGTSAGLLVSTGDRSLLLPLVLREIAASGRDATSPYGYPGPLLSAGCDTGFLETALRAGAQHLADLGFVSLFVRMHPLLCPDSPRGVGTVVHHPATVIVDLHEDDDQWWAQMRKSHRQQVRRAVAAGHSAYVDEAFRSFDFFKTTYHRTMERLGASPAYYFSDGYFDALRSALGDRLKLVVLEQGGRVWAAGLFVETNGIVQSHLSADDGSHRRGGPRKLLYAFVRDWAKARGDRWFHLGGGATAEPGLLAFKQGFSPERRPFNTLRVILREEEYIRLTRARGADPTDSSHFFPAYRRHS